MLVVDRPEELVAHVGQELGVSDWVQLSEPDLLAFAGLTGDDHWSHTDPGRAAAELPYGGVIAQGFLVLGLLTRLSGECYAVRSASRWLNYGFDRVPPCRTIHHRAQGEMVVR